MNARPLMIGLIGAVLLLLLLEGCVTVPSVDVLPEGNVQRILQSYPQESEKARLVAPAFTRDALKTISRLEEKLMLKGE